MKQNQLPVPKTNVPSTPPPSQKIIGSILRRLRELSGVSQGDLARFSAANLSYISSIESGRNNISIKKVLTLCNAMGQTPIILVNILATVELSAQLEGRILSSPDEDIRLLAAQLLCQ